MTLTRCQYCKGTGIFENVVLWLLVDLTCRFCKGEGWIVKK